MIIKLDRLTTEQLSALAQFVKSSKNKIVFGYCDEDEVDATFGLGRETVFREYTTGKSFAEVKECKSGDDGYFRVTLRGEKFISSP